MSMLFLSAIIFISLGLSQFAFVSSEGLENAEQQPENEETPETIEEDKKKKDAVPPANSQ